MKKILGILCILSFIFAMGEPIYTDEELGAIYPVSVYKIDKKAKTFICDMSKVSPMLSAPANFSYEKTRKLTSQEKKILKQVPKQYNGYFASEVENTIYTRKEVYLEASTDAFDDLF